MGFHKLAFIVLLVILTLLSWPTSLTTYLGLQQEHEILWRERVRLATEDALRGMRESSNGYGSNAYHINVYDAQEGMRFFFSSMTGDIEADNRIAYNLNAQEHLLQDIPFVIAFDSLGYVINAIQPINIIQQNDQLPSDSGIARCNLPRRYYLLKDERAIYWLSHGDLLTAMSRSANMEDIIELATGAGRDEKTFIQGDLEVILQRAKSEENIADQFPVLKRVTSVSEIKRMFLSAALEDIRDLLSKDGYITEVPDFFVQLSESEMETFEFSGFCSFLAKEKYGTHEIQLEPLISWGTLEARQDIYGYFENGNKVYCYSTCKLHQSENLQGVFPDFETAAKSGFIPCVAGVLKQK